VPRFIDPTGESTYGLGICARCGLKFVLAALQPDPNSPGLMVCEADLDQYDPYRLAARAAEPATLPFIRPDESVAIQPAGAVTDDGFGFMVTDDGLGYIVP
jgi:hypothetical protein